MSYTESLKNAEYYSLIEIPTSTKENRAASAINLLVDAYRAHQHAGGNDGQDILKLAKLGIGASHPDPLSTYVLYVIGDVYMQGGLYITQPITITESGMPLIISSSVLVTNLNVDMVDGKHVSDGASGSLALNSGTLQTDLNADKLDGEHGAHYHDAANLTGVVPASCINAVGTIGSGVWEGTIIAPSFGGTGNYSYVTKAVLYYDGTKFNSSSALYTDGNYVGIGTSTPDSNLHISGLSASDTVLKVKCLDGASHSAILKLTGRAATGYSKIFFGDEVSDEIGSILYSHATDTMLFSVGGLLKLTLSTTNVNVSGADVTISDGKKFKSASTDLIWCQSVTKEIRVGQQDNTYGELFLFSGLGKAMHFYTGTSVSMLAMRIDPYGNICIGSGGIPYEKLHVYGNTKLSSGNVIVDYNKDYTYATAKTRYSNTTGFAFIGDTTTTGWAARSAAGATIWYLAQLTWPGYGSSYHAPLNLPNGATITDCNVVYYRYGSYGSMSFGLQRVNKSTGVTDAITSKSITMGNVLDTAQHDNESPDNPAKAVIDNEHYAYNYIFQMAPVDTGSCTNGGLISMGITYTQTIVE